jgi:hypothetical protein
MFFLKHNYMAMSGQAAEFKTCMFNLTLLTWLVFCCTSAFFIAFRIFCP